MCDQAKIQSKTIKTKLLLLRLKMSSGSGATLQIVNILSNIIAINTITFPVSFCIMLREIVVKLNHFSGNVCGIEDVINVCVYLVTEARR